MATPSSFGTKSVCRPRTYIRCEMTPTSAGGEQQECLFLYGMNNKG